MKMVNLKNSLANLRTVASYAAKSGPPLRNESRACIHHSYNHRINIEDSILDSVTV